MAGSRESFQKRQKEIARMEKQRAKAAKRLERKHMPKTGTSEENPFPDEAPAGEPAPSETQAG